MSDALLSFAQVSFGGSLLKDVSFELHAGESFGVYGERRSGKSTLLRLAAGLQSPDHGSIRFEGRDISRCSARERALLLRSPIALLCAPASSPSPGDTVIDNVATCAGAAGLSLRAARRRAVAALDATGVAALGAHQITASLSPAERARVMLARALVREPRLLLVDEPAPLPSLSDRDRFLSLLRSLASERGIALLVASEELSCLQGLSVLASLSAGELCGTASPSTVVDLPRRRGASRRP